jgi:ElaB/YqjD/DUF883 family membrane-anchored ribosome-binding protein
MAVGRKIGEKVPLAVVGKGTITASDNDQENTMTDDERHTAIQQLGDQLKSLREQVESLSGSLAQIGGKAGKAVARGASVATDTVTDTVRTYPFYTVFAASAAAFLLGRLSVVQEPSYAERRYGQLRDRLSDLGSKIPPNLIEQIRSSLR